jgi:hypothetical protein
MLPSLSAAAVAAARAARRRLCGEEGNAIVLSLFLMMAMLLSAGVSLDVMRFEVTRTKLQNTLDRAVLAAADLDQTLTPETVVGDYFDKAGLGGLLTGTEVDSGLNFRTVSATAGAVIPTLLLPMVGIDTMAVPTASQANETIENVEVSLVLDISGSMRFDDRITPLRAAANEFVDMVLAGTREDDTTISIVPYAGQVNPGPAMFALAGGVRDHASSSCLFIENADFAHSGLPAASTRQVPHFMKWAIAWSHMDWGWCPTDAAAIQPMSSDADALKGFINTMRQHDGTGTHLGMKWGLALLDPTSRDDYATLRLAGAAPASSEGRPLDWDAPNAQKFIVLMTDGIITDQFEPLYTTLRDIDADALDNEANDRDTVDGIDHAKMNAEQELDLQKDTAGKTGKYGKTVSTRATNLANFYAACNLAKDQGVIIYTIAFEAPAGAAEEMRTCASTPANFFEVDQLEIAAAFSSIARQINQLRLTQ